MKSDVQPTADPTARRASDVRLVGAITADDYQRNMVLSPYGLRRLFAMLLLGARGRTHDQIAGALDVTDETDATPPALPGFHVRDGMWIARGYTTLPSFETAIRSRFGADIAHVDFGSPDAIPSIKRWVSRATGGQVPSLPLPHDDLRFVAVDALMYHVAWSQPFEVGNTKAGPFHAADGTTQVPMMHRVVSAQIFDDARGRYIRLPFTDGNSMLIALPTKNLVASTLTHAVQVLDAPFATAEVQLTLPRFSVSSLVDLLRPLERLGIADSFRPDADFTPIFGHAGSRLTFAFQQGAIAVDERGAQMAVVSVVGVDLGPSLLRTFNVDRPFAFVVEDSKTHQVLVAGIVAHP